MEETKWLKPSDSESRYGDSASVQAVMRVNAEQALYGAFIVKRFQSSDLSFLLSRSVSLFDVEFSVCISRRRDTFEAL